MYTVEQCSKCMTLVKTHHEAKHAEGEHQLGNEEVRWLDVLIPFQHWVKQHILPFSFFTICGCGNEVPYLLFKLRTRLLL